MIKQKETRPLVTAGSVDLSFRSTIDNPKNKPPPPTPHAKILRFQPRRNPPALSVCFSVSKGRGHFGRSRKFSIRPCDIDSLVRFVSSLEANRC
jgi:hypothetical protein